MIVDKNKLLTTSKFRYSFTFNNPIYKSNPKTKLFVSLSKEKKGKKVFKIDDSG